MELNKNGIWINLASLSFLFGYFCLLMVIIVTGTFCRRILHLDATLTLLEAKLESTCPSQEFDDNSCQEHEESSSSLPLPTNLLSNDILVDTQFEYGESSGLVPILLSYFSIFHFPPSSLMPWLHKLKLCYQKTK